MSLLAKRFAKAATQFTRMAQAGFLPDAFIGENTLLANLLLDHADETQTSVYMLLLDMEKAFNKCSWTFLKE